MDNDNEPLLKAAALALLKGDTAAALWALLHWGDQTIEALSAKKAKQCASNLIGALCEVAYVAEGRDVAVHKVDGVDAIEALERTWGDLRRDLPGA